MNMICTIHLMGNVVQQSAAPGLYGSPCSTLEAKIVRQSEALDYMIDDIHSGTNDKFLWVFLTPHLSRNTYYFSITVYRTCFLYYFPQ